MTKVKKKKLIKKKTECNEYYIGIDLSLNGTALVCLDNESNLHDYVTFSSTKSLIKEYKENLRFLNPSELGKVERLKVVIDEIKSFIDTIEIKDKSKIMIALEGYSHGSKGSKSFDIGELGGILKLYLFEEKYPCILVPPTRVKKFATGDGRAVKSGVAMSVYKKWGIDFTKYGKSGEDLSDAYVLAKIAELYSRSLDDNGYLKKQNKFIQDMLTDIIKSGQMR